jgi:hypothetical protein
MSALLTYTPPEQRIPLSSFPHVVPQRARLIPRPQPRVKWRMFCVYGTFETQEGFFAEASAQCVEEEA